MRDLLLVAVVCWWAVLCGAEDFDPKRTRLIDFYPRDKPRNFLFRGNMPVLNGSFAYSAIVASMKDVAMANSLSFPSNFSLVDVSYLNIFEESDLKIEEDFFKAHPNVGTFHNRVIIGTLLPPPQHDLFLIKDVVKEYIELSLDRLPGVMEFLRGLLTQDGPVVVYSHCEAGTDRTGEVSGAYYIRYLNMSFNAALYNDNHVQNRDMYKSSRNALQWYCFYLHFVKGYSQLNCLV